MDNIIERVMHPYFVVALFIGCGNYTYPKSHLKRCFSIVYIAFVWSVYAWSLYNFIIINIKLSKSLLQFLNCFMIGINVFLWMISVFITFYKYEEKWMCIKKLNFVSDTLEEIGISKEFSRIQKEIKWSLIFWFMLTCITNTVDLLTGYYLNYLYNLQNIIAHMSMVYPIYVNTILDLVIVFILRCIGTKFDKINNHIAQLSEIEDCGLRCMWKKSLIINRHYIRRTEYRKRVLWIAMHLHLELCHVARTINALYGVRMTVQMASYFVMCTGFVFIEYHILFCLGYENMVIKWCFLISTVLWNTLFLLRLLTVNHICESVSAKAERTKIVIHKLTNLIWFADSYDEIYQFGLQISLNPLKFSGMGLFYFGYKLVRSFVAWVFTIVLLLVQVDTFVLNTSSKINATMCFQ